MSSKILTLTAIITLIFSISLSAQEIGKIFTASDANSQFGRVVESKSVSTSTVKGWLNSTDDKIMFLLVKGSLTVLGDDRDLVYSTSKYSEVDEVFHMYSKSMVAELLSKGGNSNTYFENRNDVFSLTNGEYTLEKSFPCPPHCN